MKSAVIYIGERAERIKECMPLRGKETISAIWSSEDIDTLDFSGIVKDYDLFHVLLDMSSDLVMESTSRLVSQICDTGSIAIAYPILPFKFEGEVREEAEKRIPALRDQFYDVVPTDAQLLVEYGNDFTVGDAFTLMFKSIAACIGFIDRDILDNGRLGKSYGHVAQATLKSLLTRIKDKNDNAMRSMFRKYIEGLSKHISKGDLYMAVNMLPKAMDSPYYLSKENAQKIGRDLENLLPILDKLESDPVIIKNYKVRLEGVRERVNLLLR